MPEGAKAGSGSVGSPASSTGSPGSRRRTLRNWRRLISQTRHRKASVQQALGEIGGAFGG